MISTVSTVRTLQAVAMTVGLAVFLWSTGLPTIFRTAEASSITSASDTLTNSAPSLASNHTIAFTTPNGMAIGESFTLTFESNFNTAAITLGDIDLSVAAADQTLVSGASAAGQWGVTNIGTDAITFTTPTDGGVASATAMVIKIGNNATGGSNQVVNPSATTSYPIDIAGTMQDSGRVLVAIIDQVTVSANVDTILSFAVTGVGGSQPVNGTTTNAASTNTTVPFGTLVANQIKTLAHDLSVTTNAKNGYVVTVVQTGALQSSTGAVIDGFKDASNLENPEVWAAPTANVALNTTWGHWGLTTNDTDTTRTEEFASNEWASGSTTPIVILSNGGPAAGAGDGVGVARIGYQVEISALQEAGDDYTTTLRYVATPTF